MRQLIWEQRYIEIHHKLNRMPREKLGFDLSLRFFIYLWHEKIAFWSEMESIPLYENKKRFAKIKNSCTFANRKCMLCNNIDIGLINTFLMEKTRGSLMRKYKEMEANMNEISELYHETNGDEITEENLFDYLLLHPSGYIDEDNAIMNSAIAEKYYRMGYVTKGVDGHLKQQYRLTSFGLNQIEFAMSLSLLS